MVLPLLQALRLNNKNYKGKGAAAKAASKSKQRVILTKALRRPQQGQTRSETSVSNQLDIFERGHDDVVDTNEQGMVVRPVKIPNSQTLNMQALAAPFKPGTLLNPTVVKEQSEEQSEEQGEEQSEEDNDDDDVPLGLVKFKLMQKNTAYKELQMPSEGWSFSRRAISYDQFYYTARAKLPSEFGSDDDSLDDDPLHLDYDLQPQPNRRSSDQFLRHSVSASNITLSSTKQSKPVHVQVEGHSAQAVESVI
ncbi:hypothetical protein Unana1_08625 [Umbelopsis nana]